MSPHTHTTEDTDEQTINIWKCPFCEYTNEEKSDVRTHINNRTDELHLGISGWDIQIAGYDEDERLIQKPTQSKPTEFNKKEKLINAWLAIGKEGRLSVADSLVDASYGYASNIKKSLENNDISKQEVDNARNPLLIRKYREEADISGNDVIPFSFETETSLSDKTKKNETEKTAATKNEQKRDELSVAVSEGTQEPTDTTTPTKQNISDVLGCSNRQIEEITIQTQELRKLKVNMEAIKREADFTAENASDELEAAAQAKQFVVSEVLESIENLTLSP